MRDNVAILTMTNSRQNAPLQVIITRDHPDVRVVSQDHTVGGAEVDHQNVRVRDQFVPELGRKGPLSAVVGALGEERVFC